MLHATETGISSGRLGLWLVCAFIFNLVRSKDAVDPRKQDGVAYKVPCEFGKVYIG